MSTTYATYRVPTTTLIAATFQSQLVDIARAATTCTILSKLVFELIELDQPLMSTSAANDELIHDSEGPLMNRRAMLHSQS